MTQYFFLSQYSECKQADIEWILNKVSKNYCLQISRPGEGGGERFHIRFSYIDIHLRNITVASGTLTRGPTQSSAE